MSGQRLLAPWDETFESRLGDPAAPVSLALVDSSPTILIAFGGIIGALGIPPFEFFNLTKGFDTSRAYVRDLQQSWYHAGLGGVSTDVPTTAAYLSRLVQLAGATRVVLVGNSMGGYAALLFGALLGADEVHAFSPQTFIDPLNRARHGDKRWSAQLARVQAAASLPYLDLVPLLRDRAGAGAITVHYSPADALDEVHAERLATVPRVTVRAYADGGHNVIKHLRQSGALEVIVRDAVSMAPRGV